MTGPISTTTGRPTIICGNWGANPPTTQMAKNLAVRTAGNLFGLLKKDVTGKYSNVQVGIFVPSIFLPVIGHHMVFQPPHNSIITNWSDPLLLGVQTMSCKEGSMIKSCFADLERKGMVLVGHSDQREKSENNKMASETMQRAYKHGIRPFLCVGESFAEQGAKLTNAALTRQLDRGLDGVDPDTLVQAGTVIVYQGVRSTKVGKTATPEMIAETHAHIRSIVAAMVGQQAAEETPIIYGGTMDLESAPAILAQSEVDGLLIEEQSLDADEFIRFAEAVPV